MISYDAMRRTRQGECLRCRKLVEWGLIDGTTVSSFVPAVHGRYTLDGGAPARATFLVPGDAAHERFVRHRCRPEGVPRVDA